MSKSFHPSLIAPCGMNCGICLSYFGYAVNGRKRKNPCVGCRLKEYQCAFIKKQCDKLINNKIEYCFECVDFPCARLKVLDRLYRTKYGMSMIENLEYIQKNGIDNFIKKEREKWKCPKCGGIICVHNKKCCTCGIN